MAEETPPSPEAKHTTPSKSSKVSFHAFLVKCVSLPKKIVGYSDRMDAALREKGGPGGASLKDVRKKRDIRELPLVFTGLFSSDPETRKMSALFIFSFFGIFLVSGFFLFNFWKVRHEISVRHAEELAKESEATSKKQEEQIRRSESMMSLGLFNLELKAIPGPHADRMSTNMAELEIIVYCDSRSTKALIKKEMPLVRNQLIQSLTVISREELLSKEGKLRLRDALMKVINTWLPHGSVQELYISKLVFS